MDTVLSLWILSILFVTRIVAEKPRGLTLKLIHIDSPESPYYQANHTYTQRVERLAKLSKARAHHLSFGRYNYNATYNPQTIRGFVDVQIPFVFMVQLGIGTFPSGHTVPEKLWYFLQFDTGSDLVWLQCKDCQIPGNHCFFQDRLLFPSRMSRSYKPLLCDPRSCFSKQCKGKYCMYNIGFQDESSSTGYLAYERFTFTSSTGGGEESLQLLFGCGYDQRNFPKGHDNRAAGILGMGVSNDFPSFPDQIKAQSNGLFSYCVPSPDNVGRVPPSLLQFGADIPRRQNLRSTRISIYPKEEPYYFLPLIGLSVNGHRLGIQRQYFARRSNGHGGCIIDSGSSYSHLASYPFDELTEEITAHLHKLAPKLGPARSIEAYGFDFCFERPKDVGLQQLPHVTFHFDGGADLQIRPENLYASLSYGYVGYFCLGIGKSANNLNIIGAKQQVDHRFIYDTRNLRLHFGPERCNSNPRV